MTKKRKYVKPSQKVVELKHRTMLLAGSPTSLSKPNDYESGDDPFDF